MVAPTPLMCRTAASCLCPCRSHGQTGTLMISSGLAHLSGTGLLRTVHVVIASPLAIKMYSLVLSQKPTNMSESVLSSAFVRSGYHTRSPNTHLPMWCPQPRHRSNGTFPSDPTVSSLSNLVPCPVLQAMVFDSGGTCVWQLNSNSFKSVLTMPPPVSLRRKEVTDPAFLAFLTAAATCTTAGSPSLRMVTCVEPSASTHSTSFLTACGSAAPLSLHGRGQGPFLFVDPSRPTWVWHLRSDGHSQCIQVKIDHRALHASDVNVQDSSQPHNACTNPGNGV